MLPADLTDGVATQEGQAVSKPADVKAGLEAAHKAGKATVLLRVKSKEGTRFVAIAMPKVG